MAVQRSRQGFDVAYAALALARARGNRAHAIIEAEAKVKTWGGGAADLLKAPVQPNTTADWPVRESRAQFAAVVREASLIGRAGFQPGILTVKLISITDDGTASWVAENALKPITALAMSDLGRMSGHKVESLVVLTDELVRAADSAAATWLLAAMKNALARAIDSALCDPANGGDASRPASLSSGGAIIPSTGDLVIDLQAAFATLAHPENAVIAMAPATAVQVGTLTTTGSNGGALIFPAMGPRGGDMLGVPAYTAVGIPVGVVLVVDVTGIYEVDEPPVIDYSNEALVDLGDGPVSLFSENLHAWRIEQVCDWLAAPNTVATITGVFQ